MYNNKLKYDKTKIICCNWAKQTVSQRKGTRNGEPLVYTLRNSKKPH